MVEYLRLVVEFLRLDLPKNLWSNRLIATSRSGVMPSASSRVPSSRISQAGSGISQAGSRISGAASFGCDAKRQQLLVALRPRT